MFSASRPEPIGEAAVLRAWTAPGRELDREARVATTAAGEIVGYVDLERQPGTGEKLWMVLMGEPLDGLLDWAEQRAGELLPDGGRLLTNAWSERTDVRRTVETAGFRRVRGSYRMAIELDEEVESAACPAGVEIRTARAGDERAVYEVHQETFADSWEHERHPYDEWSHWLLATQYHHSDLWLLALE